MWLINSLTTNIPIWQGRRKRYLICLVSLGFLQALLILVISSLVAQVFASMNAEGTQTNSNNIHMTTPLISMLLAAIGVAFLRWAERVCAEHLGQNYVVQVRLHLFQHLMFADPRGAQRFSHGAMALRFVTDLSGLRQWVALGLARLLVVASTVLIVLIILVYQQPILMLVVTFNVLLAIALCLSIGSKLPKVIRSVRKYRARLAATVTDRINTLTTVQAHIQEHREIHRVRRQSQSLYDATLHRAYIVGGLYGSLEAITVMATTMLLIAASYLVREHSLTIVDIAASMTLLSLLLSPLRDMGRILDYWQQWRIANEKISTFLHLPKRKVKKISETSLTNSHLGHIRAHDFTIKNLLEKIDFDIPAGHHTVLEGKNGTGKTSFLFTLAGILPLQSGNLELDGAVLSNAQGERLLTNNIALVSPDVGLMRGSLLRNITYANTKASEQELADIIQHCNLTSIIERLPHGVNSKLSEGGKNLSLGERKRIMLARALLMQPSVLLLDELDAHLDSDSFNIIEHTLAQFPGTVIEVSHQRKLQLQKPMKYWRLQQARIHEYTTYIEQKNVN